MATAMAMPDRYGVIPRLREPECLALQRPSAGCFLDDSELGKKKLRDHRGCPPSRTRKIHF